MMRRSYRRSACRGGVRCRPIQQFEEADRTVVQRHHHVVSRDDGERLGLEATARRAARSENADPEVTTAVLDCGIAVIFLPRVPRRVGQA